MKKIIAITGGIGSGKSVVSRILRINGYHVYDSDSRAKALMDSRDDIHRRLVAEIHPQAVQNGIIDRPLISKTVFSDSAKLQNLNHIVHTAVIEDLGIWVDHTPAQTVFVETAILYASGMNRTVDAEWRVQAPLETRIARVMARNGLTRAQVEARIQAQKSEEQPHDIHPALFTLLNDDTTPLLPQIEALLAVCV